MRIECMRLCEVLTIFRDRILWSSVGRSQHCGRTYCAFMQGKRAVSCILEVKDARSSEMLVHVHRTTPCHIPGDHTLIDTALKCLCIISTLQSTVVTIYTTCNNTEKLCILTKHIYVFQIILTVNIISLHHTD